MGAPFVLDGALTTASAPPVPSPPPPTGSRQAIAQLLGGEPAAQTFITIIRYVLPSEDHTIQKLLLLYLVSAPSPRPRASGGLTTRPRRKPSRRPTRRGNCCRSWCVLRATGAFRSGGEDCLRSVRRF